MIRKKYIETVKTKVVDKESGELLSEDVELKSHSYIAKNNEEFFLVYTNLLNQFAVNLSSPEVKVYCQLLMSYHSDTEFALIKSLKEKIGEKIGLKLGTVNNALGSLCEKGLVIRINKSLFQLNPLYAFKGSTKNRNKALSIILKYNNEE